MSWPVVAYNWSLAPTVYEETTITDYHADFTVDDDGDLHATETLTVNFPGFGKHGIFRFFDEADPSATHARRVPHDFSVTLDGSPEPFEVLDEKNGRITNLKIGSADVTIDQGEHTYVIGYTIDGVLEPGTTGQTTQFYWNLIPGGWQQPIDKAELTVHLPVAASRCSARAASGQTGGCTAEGEGTETLTVNAESLSPNTPVTVKAGLEMPTPPAGVSVPWSARFDPVLGRSPTALALVLLIALAAGAFGAFRRVGRARRRRGTRSCMDRPTASARRRAPTSSRRRPTSRRSSPPSCRPQRRAPSTSPDPARNGQSPTRQGRPAGPGWTRSPSAWRD